MVEEGTSSKISEGTSSRISASGSQRFESRSSEERVFGRGLFRPYPNVGSTQSRAGMSWQLLLASIAVVISSFIIFLLGVNIVIQYRTMVAEDRSGLFRKAAYIMLSIMAIYGLFQANVFLLKKLDIRSNNQNSDNIIYQRLNGLEESIEMDNLR